jgi:hypothetical protein
MSNGFNLVIVFPSLPDMRLSVNGRHKLHHMEIAKIVEQEKQDAYILGKEALSKCDYWQAPQMARISYEFYCDDKRIKDIEKGLIPACGAWVDGLVAAKVLIADDGWHLWIGHGELRPANQKQTRLIIESLED